MPATTFDLPRGARPGPAGKLPAARPAAVCLAALGLVLLAGPAFGGSANATQLSRSVVKVYATVQRYDYAMPWQSLQMVHATGSGLVVAKKRILTNAHVISDAKFLQVQKEWDATLYNARVLFVGHDCDLALLGVDDESFFDDTRPAPFSRELPQLNDEVSVMGFPLGGTRISMTKGVVSRVDYSVYSHSGVDMHLVLQVDAAINPGNSGGPVFYRGKVAGLAFQNLAQGENIGYAIPVPVVDRFLADTADGQYHGYPELGVRTFHLYNPAMRKSLQLDPKQTGVAVFSVDPFGAALQRLHPKDVLLSIDGHSIDNDGTVQLDGTGVQFHELLERKQWGNSVVFEVWRAGREETVTVPLEHPRDPFIFRNDYDEKPRYLIVGGLIFSPLTRTYLGTLGQNVYSPSDNLLLYYSEHCKDEGLHTNRSEFVVLTGRLPHPVNTYHQPFVHGIVSTANNRHIGNLRNLKEALSSPVDGFHIIKFEGMDHVLIMDAKTVEAAQARIMRAYGIPSREYLGPPSRAKDAAQ